MKKIFLVSQAHLDPVWQWQWQEGAAAALSTFRTAAQLCEEYDGYIFCHNEALLYKWIKEYDSDLYGRIKTLVRQGKWHIMGGWYLQPDCNLISGESFVRQIEQGRRFFDGEFGARPTVAVNFDPFGHSRGLVQILKQAGYDGYIICRPTAGEMDLGGKEDFVWNGFDGNSVHVHRADGFYASSMGKAAEKIKCYIPDTPDGRQNRLVLWGVGNHGGGPSRKDIEDIAALKQETADAQIIHSTPEEYFAQASEQFMTEVNTTLGRCLMGCYSSQARIKKAHRALENKLYSTERICSHAAFEGRMEYPEKEMQGALEDLLLAQFHDILPGSSVQSAVERALGIMGHARYELDKLHARAYFALTAGEKKAAPGEYPIAVYNPHPFPVDTVITAEFMLAYQNDGKGWQLPKLMLEGKPVPVQLEKEESNIPLDWRKRISFRAQLPPMSVTRYSCFTEGGEKPKIPDMPADRRFDNGCVSIAFDRNGRLCSIVKGGKEYLKEGVRICAYKDCEDSWGFFNNKMTVRQGEFTLVSDEKAAHIAHVKSKTLPPLRIIQSGEVRTVIEGIYAFEDSWACIRYSLPAFGDEIGIDIRLFNASGDTLFKLEVPTVLEDTRFEGRIAFGVDDLISDGREAVAQQWIRVRDDQSSVLLANDSSYSCSCEGGVLAQTLLRSCAYCAHPWANENILPQDRFSARADIGEHCFGFALVAGDNEDIEERSDRIAAVLNDKPYALNIFPDGRGEKSGEFVRIEGNVTVEAVKPARDGGYIIRLFNPMKTEQKAVLHLPDCTKEVTLRTMQLVSLLYRDGSVSQTELIDG